MEEHKTLRAAIWATMLLCSFGMMAGYSCNRTNQTAFAECVKAGQPALECAHATHESGTH